MSLRMLSLDVPLLNKIAQASFLLGDIAECKDGIVPFIRDKMLSEEIVDNRYKPLLGVRGHYTLTRYEYTWRPIYICYDIAEARKYISDVQELRKVQLRDETIFLHKQKIITSQDSSRVKGTLDTSQFYTTNSIHTTYLKSDTKDYDIRFVLGLMNSNALNYYHKSLAIKGEDLHPQILVSNLRKLPIRTIDFGKPAEKAQHDKMVSLVERMLKLHQDKAAARLATEKTVMQTQIEATDRQIDALVYALYGLTADEIKVVEGAG